MAVEGSGGGSGVIVLRPLEVEKGGQEDRNDSSPLEKVSDGYSLFYLCGIAEQE